MFKFQPVSSSWVALHPNPQGVIFFIGGAFFGTFPTLFYRYLLRCVFEAGYTIVALPFRFTFQHWSVATSLLQEQKQLRPLLTEMAQRAGYASEIYQQTGAYFWIGHSLGCKYVALLELMSSSEWQQDSQACLEPQRAEQAIHTVNTFSEMLGQQGQLSILNQRSLLIAPDISDTDSAIPGLLARWIERLGLGVNPSRNETLCLIRNSHLFHLTALISFQRDTIAGRLADTDETKSDVRWLLNHLDDRNLPQAELPGKHLEPVGIRVGNWVIDLNPWDKFIEPIAQRKIETTVLMLLDKLAQR
jgi:hypothetical protein